MFQKRFQVCGRRIVLWTNVVFVKLNLWWHFGRTINRAIKRKPGHFRVQRAKVALKRHFVVDATRDERIVIETVHNHIPAIIAPANPALWTARRVRDKCIHLCHVAHFSLAANASTTTLSRLSPSHPNA